MRAVSATETPVVAADVCNVDEGTGAGSGDPLPSPLAQDHNPMAEAAHPIRATPKNPETKLVFPTAPGLTPDSQRGKWLWFYRQNDRNCRQSCSNLVREMALFCMRPLIFATGGERRPSLVLMRSHG